MRRAAVILGAAVFLLGMTWSGANAQVSKEADKKMQEAKSAEKKSWQQVDDINRQTDQTNARLNQARSSASHPAPAPGPVLTKKKIGVAHHYYKHWRPAKPKAKPRKK